MNRNILKILIGIVFGLVSIPCVFAYIKANQLNSSRGVMESTSIADPQTGQTLRIGTEHTVRKPEAYAIDNADSSATLVHGACTVFEITVTGVSVGDYAYIYDGTGIRRGALAGANLIREIYVGTLTNSITISFPFGLKFSNDVGIKTTDTDVDVAVAYSN